MKEQNYTQVVFRQPASEGGERVEVAFVPSQFARVGKRIRIDGLEGTWTITERGETWPAERALAKERDYRHQREASDV